MHLLSVRCFSEKKPNFSPSSVSLPFPDVRVLFSNRSAPSAPTPLYAPAAPTPPPMPVTPPPVRSHLLACPILGTEMQQLGEYVLSRTAVAVTSYAIATPCPVLMWAILRSGMVLGGRY
eukprot:940100-Rhodomonas_salina.2